jgi:hypothetical protein
MGTRTLACGVAASGEVKQMLTLMTGVCCEKLKDPCSPTVLYRRVLLSIIRSDDQSNLVRIVRKT